MAKKTTVLKEIQQFLNVDDRLDPERRYIVPIDTRELGKLPPEIRPVLDEIFRQDIQVTASLTGLDMADWLESSYSE